VLLIQVLICTVRFFIDVFVFGIPVVKNSPSRVHRAFVLTMASLMNDKVLRLFFTSAGSIKLAIQAVDRFVVNIKWKTQIAPVEALFRFNYTRVRERIRYFYWQILIAVLDVLAA
jgi:hypothetical protein